MHFSFCCLGGAHAFQERPIDAQLGPRIGCDELCSLILPAHSQARDQPPRIQSEVLIKSSHMCGQMRAPFKAL